MALTAQQKEVRLYAELTRCAELGLPCPTADDLACLIGEEDGGAISTTVLVMQRLEKQGLIHVERYQRSRVVTIMATGKKTAEPKNKAPHWRDRIRMSQECAA